MKDDRVYLWHIRDCIERILDYTKEGRDAFLNDTKTQDAVIRNLEIIGEAVKNVSEDLKKVYPDIPWQRIAGMRDRMIHEYFGVNLQIVWERVEEDVPDLKQKVQAILKALEKNT
ncbi:MAG: HepT-like ribonuclease domain-containing protein [Gammaproteobacteria bacterium]